MAKSLFSNFMKINLKIEKDNKIVVAFLNKKGQTSLAAALDDKSFAMLEPQEQLLSYAREFEKYGNIALLMLRLWRYAQSKSL